MDGGQGISLLVDDQRPNGSLSSRKIFLERVESRHELLVYIFYGDDVRILDGVRDIDELICF